MGVTLREKKIAGGKATFYLDIYHKRKRFYEFLNIHVSINKPSQEDKTKKQLAQEIKIQREHQLIAEDHGLLNKQKKRAGFVRFFEGYISSKTSNNNLSATLFQLNRFVGKQSLPIISVTTGWMKDFERFLLKSVAGNTALSYLKNISAALNELVSRQVIASNPWHAVPRHERLKKKDVIRKAWTLDQLRQMADTPCNIEPQFMQAYFFACFTGLRWSDINKLLWSNIIEKRINGHTEWFLHFEQQKTKALEYLPLSDQAIEILKERRFELEGEVKSIYVFPKVKETDVKNKPVHGRMNYALKKWAKAAGLPDWKKMGFHTGRHSYATNLIELTNGDIYTVSKLLGHKSIQTTQIYAQVRDQMKYTAVKALPKIRRLRSCDSLSLTSDLKEKAA